MNTLEILVNDYYSKGSRFDYDSNPGSFYIPSESLKEKVEEKDEESLESSICINSHEISRHNFDSTNNDDYNEKSCISENSLVINISEINK